MDRTIVFAAGLIAALLALALAPISAMAQDRSPADRQTLADLAYALGESHALRQTCHGAADQFWRSRMERLVETEAAEQNFTARVSQSFNAGFAAAEAAFPACDDKAKAETARVAGKGKRLAASLRG